MWPGFDSRLMHIFPARFELHWQLGRCSKHTYLATIAVREKNGATIASKKEHALARHVLFPAIKIADASACISQLLRWRYGEN